jgi:hypothetical protein
MGKISFSDAEYAGKRKKTRREVFLEEMEHVVPWKALLGKRGLNTLLTRPRVRIRCRRRGAAARSPRAMTYRRPGRWWRCAG